MEKKGFSTKISKVCLVICLLMAGYGLIIGISSIGAPGLDGIGKIFIPTSVVALLIVLFDYLIIKRRTKSGKTKRGFVYTFISLIIKCLIIVYFIIKLFNDYEYEIRYSASNLYFDIVVVCAMTIFTIPTIINVIKLGKEKSDRFGLAIKVVVIVIAIIISSIVLYNTIGKRIIYTPAYMANHTESYAEQKFNEYERTKYTEQDRIMYYISSKLEQIQVKTHWVTDKDSREEYIKEFMDKCTNELPNVNGWEYIADMSIIEGIDITDDYIDSHEKEAIAKYIGKTWNTNHLYQTSIAGIESTAYLILVYYDDGTMDAVDLGYLE